MLLVLDNYDSFTWNLVQYLGQLGAEPHVARNDQLTVERALNMGPRAVVISPGPCTPDQAGISVDLIRAAAERGIPLLGVCLGHQAIAVAFGGNVVRARRPMHGKTSQVFHNAEPLFNGIPSPLEVMRYHSLIVDPETIPAALELTAWTEDSAGNEVMAVKHRTAPVWGVQFHPESVGTASGKRLLENFCELSAVTA